MQMKTKQDKTSVQILRYLLALKKHLEESNNIIDRDFNVELQKKYRVPWNIMRIAKEIRLICNPKVKTWIFIYQPDIECVNKILSIKTFLTLHPTIKISEIKNYPQCSFVFKPRSRRTRAFMTFFREEKIPWNRPLKDKTRKFKTRKINTSDALLFPDVDLVEIDENFTDPFNLEEPIVRDYALSEESKEATQSNSPKLTKSWIDNLMQDQEEIKQQELKIIDQNQSKRKSIESAKEVYMVTTFMQNSTFVQGGTQVAGEKVYESWHNSHEEAILAAKQAALIHPNEVIFIMKCLHRFKTEVSVIEI